jgi:hypothetical protein
MLKRKFGDSVRSKTDVAMRNEALFKILAHNLCVLIQEQHELGIDPVFWQDDADRIIAEAAKTAESDCYGLLPMEA